MAKAKLARRAPIIELAKRKLMKTRTLVGASVKPVPEPSIYVMLMAGLGAIGAMARRRNTIGSA